MDIEKLLEELRKNLLTVLGEKYEEFKPEIQKDVNDFLDRSREKLERWSLLLVAGSLTEEELFADRHRSLNFFESNNKFRSTCRTIVRGPIFEKVNYICLSIYNNNKKKISSVFLCYYYY